MKNILVLGAGGFIGSHVVDRMKARGHLVVGVDIKKPPYSPSRADFFHVLDLRIRRNVTWLAKHGAWDEIYQFAAEMGGAKYIFTGEHDADIMRNSAQININVCECFKETESKILYASSACIYPQEIQYRIYNPALKEIDAYPANPDSDYGWEKLFSERLYLAHAKNYGMKVRIARFHNVFGPCGAYDNDHAKAPAALCYKVAVTPESEAIEVLGDGEQTRSFLYIEDALDGITKLMESDYPLPINIGSNYVVSINELVTLIMDVSGKALTRKHIEGPQGVRGRNSDNTLCKEVLNWSPKYKLRDGIEATYKWIFQRVNEKRYKQW